MKKFGKEKVMMFSILTFCMLIILVLVVLLYTIQFKAANLELENKIERNYSQMLMAFSEGSQAVEDMMRACEVTGFGVFRGNIGSRELSWGDALEIEDNLLSFFRDTNVPYFRKSNNIGFDSSSGKIRIIRALGSTPESTIERDYWIDPNANSSIVYISFSADSYLNSIKTISITLALFVFFLFLVYAIVSVFAFQNLKYRQKLNEQSTLVAMGQAARTLTHEIKNPLSAITLQLALLKRISPEEIKEDLGVIESETKKLIMLTNRVSDFLRNPIGERENIDLVSVLEKQLKQFPSSVKFYHPNLKEAVISFDPDRINSVIENVIRNAVDASDLNGGEYDIEIDLYANKTHNGYILKVKDRGIGIKPEDLPKVFEPFFTTKVHGSGIGLPITKQFLTATGDSIELKPREGGGTEAILTFHKATGTQKKVGEGNESTDL